MCRFSTAGFDLYLIKSFETWWNISKRAQQTENLIRRLANPSNIYIIYVYSTTHVYHIIESHRNVAFKPSRAEIPLLHVPSSVRRRGNWRTFRRPMRKRLQSSKRSHAGRWNVPSFSCCLINGYWWFLNAWLTVTDGLWMVTDGLLRCATGYWWCIDGYWWLMNDDEWFIHGLLMVITDW